MVKKVVYTLLSILGVASLFVALPTLSLGRSIGLADVLWDIAIATVIVLSWKQYTRVWNRKHATRASYEEPDSRMVS